MAKTVKVVGVKLTSGFWWIIEVQEELEMKQYQVGQEVVVLSGKFEGQVFIVDEPKNWGVQAFQVTPKGELYARFTNEEVRPKERQ
jgi:hypothetical protein